MSTEDRLRKQALRLKILRDDPDLEWHIRKELDSIKGEILEAVGELTYEQTKSGEQSNDQRTVNNHG